jgi:tetratricopeptide (TPR) repeat protein
VTVIPLWGHAAVNVTSVSGEGGSLANPTVIADLFESDVALYSDFQELSGTRDLDALEHYLQANTLLKQGNYHRSMVHLMEALLIDPGYREARMLLVDCYLQEGHNDAAIEIIEQGLSNDPGNDALIALRARIYLADSDLNNAALILEDALGFTDNDESVLALTASVRYQQGHFNDASLLYRELSLQYPQQINYMLGEATALDKAGLVNDAVPVYKMIAQQMAVSNPNYSMLQQRLSLLSD